MSRIMLSTGTLPSPELEQLTTSHPFIEQIDVVFPSTAQENVFTSLKTTYSTAKFTLSELYAYASSLAIPSVPFKAVPIQDDADETWCIDPRGVLTLSVSKTLYEQLGIVGRKLPFKGCPERYVIEVSLKRETSVGVQARQRAALAIWDRVRETAGLGRWDVAYTDGATPTHPLTGDASTPETHTVDVAPRVRREADVYVPHVGALAPAEDPERLEALFEWVGMACLGAQRLRANDRVDPYVAVYEPPPASIGAVTHLRWKGLMATSFVQSVIDTAVSVLASGDDNLFVAITLHSNRVAPVSYTPSLTKDAPPRVPGLEAEDTVCVVLSKSSDRSTWAIAQSIGKWDARWG